MGNATHIRDAIRRHTSPGALLLLLFSLIVFGPRLIDAARGEPWIENELGIIINSAGEPVVRDVTITRNPVIGLRANTIEDENAQVICSTEHHNTWVGERNRLWQISAFTGCPPPGVPYRICSSFSVTSEAGRAARLGPFCSTFAYPEPALQAMRLPGLR